MPTPRRVPSPFALAFALALPLIAAACSGDDTTGVPGGEEGGTVSGVVVAADGETPIAGAVVSLAEGAGTPSDTSDVEGRYRLEGLPAGRQTLVARRGVYEARIEVTVDADEAVSAPAAELRSTGKLGYVAGDFDAIEEIVRDRLGNPMTELFTGDFLDASLLAQYKMIFINCGASTWAIMEDPEALANLRDYVRAGGIVYASDLTLDLVQALFPDVVAGELVSSPAQSVAASVSAAALRQAVGKSTVNLVFDLDSWLAPSTLGTGAEVLVRGDVESDTGPVADHPLAFVIASGAGKLVFTSFHNEQGLTDDQLAVLLHFAYLD